jgi:hypothetical protein
MMKPILALASFAVFAAPALAQQVPPVDADAKAAAKFAMHDTNKDGALSMSEVTVADASVTATDFDRHDANKDKALSQDEFTAWLEAKTPAPTDGQ